MTSTTMPGTTQHIFKQRIGGEWTDAADGGTWDLLDPATEKLIEKVPFGGRADAEAAVAAAAGAFPAWSQSSPDFRADLLQKVADAMGERFDDLLPLVIAETGCTATVGKQMQVPQARVEGEVVQDGHRGDHVVARGPVEAQRVRARERHGLRRCGEPPGHFEDRRVDVDRVDVPGPPAQAPAAGREGSDSAGGGRDDGARAAISANTARAAA